MIGVFLALAGIVAVVLSATVFLMVMDWAGKE